MKVRIPWHRARLCAAALPAVHAQLRRIDVVRLHCTSTDYAACLQPDLLRTMLTTTAQPIARKAARISSTPMLSANASAAVGTRSSTTRPRRDKLEQIIAQPSDATKNRA